MQKHYKESDDQPTATERVAAADALRVPTDGQGIQATVLQMCGPFLDAINLALRAKDRTILTRQQALIVMARTETVPTPEAIQMVTDLIEAFRTEARAQLASQQQNEFAIAMHRGKPAAIAQDRPARTWSRFVPAFLRAAAI
jgi:hypothetical protein